MGQAGWRRMVSKAGPGALALAAHAGLTALRGQSLDHASRGKGQHRRVDDGVRDINTMRNRTWYHLLELCRRVSLVFFFVSLGMMNHLFLIFIR